MKRLLILLMVALDFAYSSEVSAAQWYRVLGEDRPVTVSASGIVISSDVLHFGPPPNRDWQTTLVQLAGEGQVVAKGDVLARFDGSNLDKRVRELTGRLAVRHGELKGLEEQQSRAIEDEKIALAAAESLAKKSERKASQPAELIAGMEYARLVERKRVAAKLWERTKHRQTLSERLRTAKRAELAVVIKQLGIQLAVATQELGAFTIRAPRSGLAIIGTTNSGRKLDISTSVHPGLVVVELVDNQVLAVQAEIAEHKAARLGIGQPVRIEVDSAGGAELRGRISSVANTVRRQSMGSLAMVRDITVELAPGQAGALRLGTSVQLTVELSLVRDALAVPSTALVYRSGSPGVMLRDGDWRSITLGERSEDMYIVTSGLVSGQEVRL